MSLSLGGFSDELLAVHVNLLVDPLFSPFDSILSLLLAIELVFDRMSMNWRIATC